MSQMFFNFAVGIIDHRITFVRGSLGSYFDADGVLQIASVNTPRFDYDPITLACRGMLIEEERTNLCLQSEDFSTTWSNTRTSEDTNVVVAPDGTMTGDKLVEDTTANASHVINQSITVSAGTTYTGSVYFRAAERTWAFINLTHVGVSSYRSWFNLSAGTVGTSDAGNTVTITSAGNGWYRATATRATAVGQTSIRFEFGLATDDGNISYTGNGVSGIYIWGAQLEAGAFPTSYIPTTTAAVTRNADVATITGTNFSGWWQASKGGVLVRARPGTVSGTRPWVQFDDGTADNIIALRGVNADPQLYIKATTDQATIDAGTIAANTDYSLTGWWQTNDCKARLNNGAVVTDTTATIPTVTQARLGSDGTNYLNGHLASISYYDTFSGQIYTRRKNKAVFNLM